MSARGLVDALLAVAWVLLVADLLRASARAGVSPVRRAIGLVLLAVMLAAGSILEGAAGGRLVWHPAAAVLGVALAWLGLGLYVRARQALGGGWSPIVAPPEDAPLVESGPYAHVRHPLYAAILLMAAGTLAAHVSRATIAAGVGFAVGIALKGRAEDRELARRFGERWRAYAARVPAFVPRLNRGRP
ncbi:MAG TPA: isoprenylcysteine carboxylmethyltransferase family protein [Candidatus Limnocylindria bacterium]|nr:isoprenylcysteine carboxylmethyltransferase family protein [Candidatus Limnocylindria bacterium]